MVSVRVPCTGRASRTMTASTASAAEISDDQKPGMWRAQNVTISPPMPLIRNIQPRKMVTARLASGGTTIAASPSTASRMPSNKKVFQCALTAALMSDCNLLMSLGRVIASSPGTREPDGILKRFRAQWKPVGEKKTRQPEGGLSLSGCRRIAFRRRPHPIAAENINRRGGHQQREADQDRCQPDRAQNQRRVALRIDEPVRQRSQQA